MRVLWRKNYRLGPQRPKILRRHRYRKYVLCLTSAAVEPRQFSADNNVRIERIGDDITIFLGRDRLPIAKRDLTRVAAAFDSDRTAFLLSAVKPVGERVVCAHVIQLRARLIVPRAPGRPAVNRYDRSLVRAEQNDVGIVRTDPNILVIAAAGRAAPAVPRFPAVD